MANIGAGATGTILQGAGAGTAPVYSPYTLPATVGSTGNILRSNGTNFTSTLITGGGWFWTNVTGSTQTVFASSGYIADKATLITFTMNTSNLGDAFRIVGFGAGGWTLLPTGAQIFYFGNKASTVTTGSLSSTLPNDCIEMVALSSTQILIMSSIGNITVV